jgi:hypothetical protein
MLSNFNTIYENKEYMKPTSLLMISLLMVPSSLMFSVSGLVLSPNPTVYATCNEITDPNVVCNEQHNTRSNTLTTTTSSNTTTSNTDISEEDPESALCFDITCSLTQDYITDYEIDSEDSLSDVIDY